MQDAYAPEHDLYGVNGDLYRRYHPEHDFLISEPDPEVFPRETAALSGALVERTLQWAKDERVSVMVEGTMRRPEVTSGTLDSFHRSGFKTHLVVLAVPQAFSWQGCVNRYLLALHARGVGRWAPLSAHQAGWDGVPRTLAHVMGNGNVDRVSVVRRDGETLFYIEDVQRVQASVDEALAALECGRAR